MGLALAFFWIVTLIFPAHAQTPMYTYGSEITTMRGYSADRYPWGAEDTISDSGRIVTVVGGVWSVKADNTDFRRVVNVDGYRGLNAVGVNAAGQVAGTVWLPTS